MTHPECSVEIWGIDEVPPTSDHVVGEDEIAQVARERAQLSRAEQQFGANGTLLATIPCDVRVVQGKLGVLLCNTTPLPFKVLADVIVCVVMINVGSKSFSGGNEIELLEPGRYSLSIATEPAGTIEALQTVAELAKELGVVQDDDVYAGVAIDRSADVPA